MYLTSYRDTMEQFPLSVQPAGFWIVLAGTGETTLGMHGLRGSTTTQPQED